ncbi:MAG: RNA methyltransferase [Deltaproteobacteria bacterium]|nr:RNA methyltransferase [Deltaproteobacteria bacterium]
MEPSRVIEVLEPLLTPRRAERMRAVLASRTDQVTFVFERMIDPHNLSAALRSLDAFSFQDAYLIEPGERLEVSRGISIGSHRWLSVHQSRSAEECIASLQSQGYAVYASHLGGEECAPLDALDFSRRTALVFGNEHAGVGPEVLEHADARFRIDMYGFVESLNLSVAVAISAHHARRELEALAAAQGSPAPYPLNRERREALYAEWLRGSVYRADEILAQAREREAATPGKTLKP